MGDLRETLDGLSALSKQKRGPKSEEIVRLLFRRAHFTVRRNARTARPRQTDLFAYSDRRHYLVEVKAKSRRAGVDDLDGLWARLRRGPGDVIGVLISFSGFTNTVVAQIAEHRDHPILLVGRPELNALAGGSGDMRVLLERKLDALTLDGIVDLESESAEHLERPSHVSRRERPPSLVLSGGDPVDWISGAGSFGAFTFVRSLTDPSWGPGPATSVVLDVSLSVESQKDLLSVLDDLGELGWLSRGGHWCIQQSTTNWHGVGEASLRTALERWQERYQRAGNLHYREEACYADSFQEGLYTLTFDVAADRSRRIWHAKLSLELSGIPLDQQPVQELCRTLGDARPLHFRLRPEPVLNRCNLRSFGFGLLPAAAYVVVDESDDCEQTQFVSGVALKNPFRRVDNAELPAELPPPLRESELLICDVQDWHALGDGPSAYTLTTAEWGWTSDGLVVRVRADWDDPDFERRLDARFQRRSRGSAKDRV